MERKEAHVGGLTVEEKAKAHTSGKRQQNSDFGKCKQE